MTCMEKHPQRLHPLPRELRYHHLKRKRRYPHLYLHLYLHVPREPPLHLPTPKASSEPMLLHKPALRHRLLQLPPHNKLLALRFRRRRRKTQRS